MSDDKINVIIGANLAELIEGMRAGAEAVEAGTLQMKGALAGLNAAFETAMAPLLAFMAVLQGGHFLGEAIGATVDMNKEATKLGRQLGVSANEAGALAIAIEKVHGTTEGYSAAATMLTRQIKNNEDGVKAMGVQTRNADGSLRNMQDIMMSAIDTLKGYKEGTDRNLAAQTLFGRGAANLGPILKLTSEAMEEAKKKQEELGLTITKEGQERVAKYRDAMTEAKEVMEAVKVAIGNAVLPMFTALGEWFANNGVTIVNAFRVAMEYLGEVIDGVASIIGVFWDAVSEVFKALAEAVEQVFGKATVDKIVTFGNALKIVQIAFLILKDNVQLLLDVVVMFVEVTIAGLQGWANTVKALLALDFAGAKAAWNAGMKAQEDRVHQGVEKIKADLAGVAPEIAKVWNASTPKETPANDTPKKGGKSYTGTDDTAEKAKLKALMDGLEHELQLEKQKDLEKSVQTNQNNQMTLAQEAAFWGAKLKEQTNGSEAYNAIQKKYDAAHLADLAQRFQREQALGAELLAGQEAQALAAVNQRQVMADRDVQLGLTTNAQKLEQDRQFETQRYNIQSNAIAQRMALLKSDPNSDPASYAKLLDQKLALEAAYQSKLTALETQSELARTQVQRQASQTISQSWGQAMGQLATGQASFASTVRSMWQGVVSAVANAIAQMIEHWLMTQAMAFITSKAAKTTAAAGQIASNAGVAASGAIAATALIPFVGPGLAPAAGAAAFSEAMAFMPTAAAARGFDIPQGVNPVTQLHQREMVLPADLADNVRNLTGAKGAHGGVTFHIHAIDGRSTRAWLTNGGGDEIIKHLQRANRNFQGPR